MNKINKARLIPITISLKKTAKSFQNYIFPNREKQIADKILKIPKPKWFTYIDRGYFQLRELEFLIDYKEKIEDISNYLLQHRFSLLGSGWICRNFQIEEEEIFSNLPKFWNDKAKKIFAYLNESNYQHIDFWTDPLSTYRWLPTFHKDYAPMENAEIKQVWELGRMQYLPILAYSYALRKFQGEHKKAKQLILEFENQILDFISTNPPFYSVQWSSPMDVGIRLANWLITFDLFISADGNFSAFFQEEFYNSVYKHILFLLRNLEWSDGLRANHYFANITSLAVASAYVPFSDFQLQLYVFAMQEIIQETLYQFYPDGGNFEGSTMYHFQVAEMLFLALYFLLNLGENIKWNLANFKPSSWIGRRKIRNLKKQKFSYDSHKRKIILPNDFLSRLQNIIKFSESLKKPNKEIEQIGDNDSGRFLRLDFFLESNTNMSDNLLKFNIIWALQKNLTGMQSNSFYESLLSKRNKYIPFDIFLIRSQKSQIQSFEHFGLVVVKKPNYFLTFRCGNIGQRGKGGHSHNDQLSLTLNYKGFDFIIDTGTYCYTKSIEERNFFRSVKMHNTVVVENQEQNLWDNRTYDDIFWITKHRTKARLTRVTDDTIVGEHFAHGKPTRRTLKLNNNQIIIVDNIENPADKKLHLHLHPNISAKIEDRKVILQNSEEILVIEFTTNYLLLEEAYFSPEYGVKLVTKRIVANFSEMEFIWKIILPEGEN